MRLKPTRGEARGRSPVAFCAPDRTPRRCASPERRPENEVRRAVVASVPCRSPCMTGGLGGRLDAGSVLVWWCGDNVVRGAGARGGDVLPSIGGTSAACGAGLARVCPAVRAAPVGRQAWRLTVPLPYPSAYCTWR